MAFVIAGPDGAPAWEGKASIADPSADQAEQALIRRLRRRGGDVAISFGGEAGTELAISQPQPETLESAYEQVIARYRLQWADFDVEGAALQDAAANDRRNIALAALERRHPALRVTYTLPVDPGGLSEDSLSLLRDARRRGVRVDAVNLMVMDYPAKFAAGGQTMAALAIASAERTQAQLSGWMPGLSLGLTPMLGRNDEPGQVFTVADAGRLCRWARSQPWVSWLSYWSVNRDSAGYAHIFGAFGAD